MKRTICALAVTMFMTHGMAVAHEDGEGREAVAGDRAFQLLKGLPMEPEAYHEPVAALVRAGVPEKFGHEEWAAVVLAQELHQHIGIITIVGAKMAIRAREELGAPPRSVSIVSETGPEPPFSCAVDGMQAGMGSTYAQQLISAPPVERPCLAATFTYEGHSVRVVLRDAYQRQIGGCIQEAIKAHGNLTPAYFEAIEEFSYHVWAEFDRKACFEVIDVEDDDHHHGHDDDHADDHDGDHH